MFQSKIFKIDEGVTFCLFENSSPKGDQFYHMSTVKRHSKSLVCIKLDANETGFMKKIHVPPDDVSYFYNCLKPGKFCMGMQHIFIKIHGI